MTPIVFGGPHSFTVAWASSQFHDKNPVLYKALIAAFQEATEMLNKEFTRKSFLGGGMMVISLAVAGSAAAATGNTPFAARGPQDYFQNNNTIDQWLAILDGATEITPDRVYRQLKEGGRLVGVFATTQPPRAAIVTHSHGDFGHRALFDATVPVLPGLERVPAFVF